MYLESLQIQNVRNIGNAQLTFSPHLNLITGVNGAGKTSLLEAIHILSTGYSFRTREVKKVIQYENENVLVSGNVVNPALSERAKRLAIQKDRVGNTEIRIDREKQSKLSLLSRQLPCVSIDTNSIELVEGGPSVRRKVLDWGMFHVEHSYLELLTQYKKAHGQKYQLLKTGVNNSNVNQLDHWNKVLVDLAEKIDGLREAYCDAISVVYQDIHSNVFSKADTTQLIFYRGWNHNKYESLLDCLNKNKEQEINRRSCLWGPHRADFTILYEGVEAKEICSRGQKKLVLYGVRLAQIRYMLEKTGYSPVVLLDDLPAELDKHNQHKVLKFLRDFECQSFITSIESLTSLQDMDLAQMDVKMFHVEHGTIT